MELGLSLGDTHEKSLSLVHKSNEMVLKDIDGLGFCMRLTPSSSITTEEIMMNSKRDDHRFKYLKRGSPSTSDPSVQLQLLHKPFPWLPQNQNFLNRKHAVATEEDPGTGSSSPDSSMMSSFRKEFAHVYKRDTHHHHHHHLNHEIEADGEHINNSRGGSDEDENGALSRKKLRLTKDQSAFLEDSFKQHHTLNPKQKLALAKQLKLRPRQVEVWFQNRRARTKLKQTEVDCEYLKRCCETLREENKRLQKELQELRALKSCNPNFYMQLPATTLTMCPSCERLQAASTVTAATPPPPDHSKPPRLHTFLQDQSHALQASN